MRAHPADLSHIETWVFDLDHTLYTVGAKTYAEMSERICLYLQRALDLPREAAFSLQKDYLARYGSTLAGLLRHHSIDAGHYHDFVNDIGALGLTENPHLRAGLTRLGGRRLIFTNNCGRYAQKVLGRLGIGDLFHDIIDAHAMGEMPKPNPPAYDLIGAAPATAALFDDSLRNLQPAHARGMTTIWCSTGPWPGPSALPEHVHHQTADLPVFLHSIRIAP